MLAETQQEIFLRGQDLGQLQGIRASQGTQAVGGIQASGAYKHQGGRGHEHPMAHGTSSPHLCHLNFAVSISVILVHELFHLVTQVVVL